LWLAISKRGSQRWPAADFYSLPSKACRIFSVEKEPLRSQQINSYIGSKIRRRTRALRTTPSDSFAFGQFLTSLAACFDGIFGAGAGSPEEGYRHGIRGRA